ncbi:unnamed protein product, partial [Urochloa humidicola]
AELRFCLFLSGHRRGRCRGSPRLIVAGGFPRSLSPAALTAQLVAGGSLPADEQSDHLLSESPATNLTDQIAHYDSIGDTDKCPSKQLDEQSDQPLSIPCYKC